MASRRNVFLKPVSFVALAAMIISFQNCTSSGRYEFSGAVLKSEDGGTGIDGKIYSNYGACEPMKIGVVSAVAVKNDLSSAWIVRDACADLSAPVAVAMDRVTFTSKDRQTLLLDDRLFTVGGFNDGAAASPAGAPQRPSLLSGYPTRAAWKIAGVDYAVGIPSNAVLKDPSTISMSGVSVNAASKIVRVTGNGVVLDAYDFSSSGGWQVLVSGADVSILNSRFGVGANALAPIDTTTSARNLRVAFSVLDGGGAIETTPGSLIRMRGIDLTVEYCWLKNAGYSFIIVTEGGRVDLHNNLMENSAQKASGIWLQSFGGRSTPLAYSIKFNTVSQANSNGSMGFSLEPDMGASIGVIGSAEVANNTLISGGNGINVSYFLGITLADIVDSVVVHDNDFDLTHSYGIAAGGRADGAKSFFSANRSLVNGAALPDHY